MDERHHDSYRSTQGEKYAPCSHTSPPVLSGSDNLRSVEEYYMALRTLAHAWAWAGNFSVKQQDGSVVLFMDLSTAL